MSNTEKSVEIFRSTEEITGVLPELGARSPEVDRKLLADEINGITSNTPERSVEEIESLIDEEILIEDGGFVSEFDASRYGNTGYDIELIKASYRKLIEAERQKREEAVIAERERILAKAEKGYLARTYKAVGREGKFVDIKALTQPTNPKQYE